MRSIQLTFILLLSLFVTTTAFGDESTRPSPPLYALRVGFLDHDSDGLWSGTNREDGVDINLEAVFTPSFVIWRGVSRPAVGASVNTSGDTSKIYGDARWRCDFRNRLFMMLGIGLALHDGETEPTDTMKGLGSPLLFHVPLEFGFHLTPHYSLSIYFDHISNAYLTDHNEGLDTWGMRLGYRF